MRLLDKLPDLVGHSEPRRTEIDNHDGLLRFGEHVGDLPDDVVGHSIRRRKLGLCG
jgi:hypothetical protein